MASDSDKLLQLKLYHLFASADGPCSSDERSLITHLLSQAELGSYYTDQFQSFCNQPVPRGSALKKVQDLLNEESYSGLNRNKRMQARTLWTFVDLGDAKFTPERGKILDYLVNLWKVDELLLHELIDAGEAILALADQKDWVEETMKSDQAVQMMVKEIDRNIDSLYAEIDASIFDADIA